MKSVFFFKQIRRLVFFVCLFYSQYTTKFMIIGDLLAWDIHVSVELEAKMGLQ